MSGKNEISMSDFLTQISRIATSRDGLEKLYHFIEKVAASRFSVGVADSDFMPVLGVQDQPQKSASETITVMPVQLNSLIHGVVYIVCADDQSHAEFKIEQPLIETLIRIVATAIEQNHQEQLVEKTNQNLNLKIINAIVNTEKKNSQLYEAEQQAQQASQAKTEFLANMSHEIRTPLNGVIGTIALLRRTPLTKDQKLFIEALEFSAENLHRIVNDILDLAKIESGHQTLQNEPLYLSDLILQCCDLYHGSAEKKQINLQYNISELENIKVIGDSLRIRQIVSNLITNAIKFTDRGSVIVWATNEVQPDSVKYRIEVIDTGVGIAEEDHKKLFQKFSQLDGSSKKKAAGTGLGLSICQNLVNLFGGEIGVDSEFGEGSTFWFEITLKREAEVSDQKPVATEDLLKWDKLKILVAEDNLVNQMIIRKMLEGLNCEVTITENGEKFIDKIKTANYDLAFLDCQMPVVDGFDACKQLRADKVQTPPIIALTAYALASDRQRCFDAGMDDYLAKPVNVAVIKEMMEKWYDKKLG